MNDVALEFTAPIVPPVTNVECSGDCDPCIKMLNAYGEVMLTLPGGITPFTQAWGRDLTFLLNHAFTFGEKLQ